MNLRQLEAFAEVAEQQSFSKAAKGLFLSQPTISAHIASLEKELNAKLFSRNTRTVSLTEGGEILYQYAREMLHLEQLVLETFQVEKPDNFCLRIAASTIPSQYLLPQILARYREKYPEEQVQLTEADSVKVVEAVGNRKADLGFTGTAVDKSVCKFVPFYDDELILILPNNDHYQTILKEQKGVGWIEDEPMILREIGSGTRWEAEKQLRAAGVDTASLNVVANIDNPETIKRSVKNGVGITMMSRLAVQESIAAGDVLEYPLGEKKKIRQLYMVYHKEYPLTKSARRMMRVVREIYQ